MWSRSNISYMHGESNVLSKGWKLLQWRVSSTKSSRCIRSILSPACLCQLHIATWVHLLLLFLFPVHSNSWTQTVNIHIYAALPPSFIVSLLITWNSGFYNLHVHYGYLNQSKDRTRYVKLSWNFNCNPWKSIVWFCSIPLKYGYVRSYQLYKCL